LLFRFTPLFATSIVLVAFVVLSDISSQFSYFSPWLERPTYTAVSLMMLASGAYLWLIYYLYQKYKDQVWQPFGTVSLVSGALFIGLALRLVMMDSTPIFEDDFYRYFFDGGLVNHGLNPYLYAPQQAMVAPESDRLAILGIATQSASLYPELGFLAEQPLVERVAYPHIKTIYPPVAQFFFALSYQFASFDLSAWRWLLLVVDVLSVGLLIVLLKQLNRGAIWSAVYWLNPLVIAETFNAGHMDVLLLPFILGTLILLNAKRFVWAMICLAFAVGVKLWPIILAPIIVRPLLSKPKYLLIVSGVFICVLVLLLSPQVIPALQELFSEKDVGAGTAGVVAYAQDWRTNSWIFGLIEDSLIYLSEYQLVSLVDPQLAARVIVGLVVLVVLFALSLRPWTRLEQLISRCLWLIAILFFVSPASYPWYIVWFLPLLALVFSTNNAGLLLLTFTLPLYDLRYPLLALDKQELFSQWITMAQFLPVIICMVCMAYCFKSSPQKKPLTT
jgi:hypothetical protein